MRPVLSSSKLDKYFTRKKKDRISHSHACKNYLKNLSQWYIKIIYNIYYGNASLL